MNRENEITVRGKMVICESEDIRVVWILDVKGQYYTLEVQDFNKGWVPLVLYDTKNEAIAGMDALVAASLRETEEE